MLVLTRKVGEQIIIGGNIKIMITAIKGDKIRIGIVAPPDVRVDREEVYRRIQEFAEAAEVAEPAIVHAAQSPQTDRERGSYVAPAKV